jgi:hypothetical protein
VLKYSLAIGHVNVEFSMFSPEKFAAHLFSVKASNLARYQNPRYRSSSVVVTSQNCVHRIIFYSSEIREPIIMLPCHYTDLKSYAASSREGLMPLRLTLIVIKS